MTPEPAPSKDDEQAERDGPSPWSPNDAHVAFTMTFADGSQRQGSFEIPPGELLYDHPYGIPAPSANGEAITPGSPTQNGATVTFGTPEGDDYPSVSVTGSNEASLEIDTIQWTHDGMPVGPVILTQPPESGPEEELVLGSMAKGGRLAPMRSYRCERQSSDPYLEG